jgi:predicted enzyme related to lactoylglutathione lyase
MFALLMPATLPFEQTQPPQVGDLSWNELVTTDHVAAFDFYRGLFGWEKTGQHDMGPVGVYQMFGRKGHTLGAMFNKPAGMPFPPHWLPYTRVDDIRRAADAIQASGGKVVHGPIEVPGEDWIVQAFDPQGAYFALHQRKTT